MPIEMECVTEAPVSCVGVDLASLANAQWARKKPKRIRNIHAKIASGRKEFLHTEGRKIVNPYGLVVGDVRASKLAKSRAKSVLDASWAGFGRTLSYKAMTRGACV
jgi:putative transposase